VSSHVLLNFQKTERLAYRLYCLTRHHQGTGLCGFVSQQVLETAACCAKGYEAIHVQNRLISGVYLKFLLG
jgi:ATP-dependent Clp protease adapter protein ClpS